MNLEGSRKFIVMLLALISTFVVAKFGPAWGGIFSTGAAVAAPMIGAGLYYLINYLTKTSSDIFVPENWLSGKRTVIGIVLTMIAPLLATASIESKDVVTQAITLIADLAVPGLYALFQGLSDKKMKTNIQNGVTSSQSTTGTTQYDYQAGAPNQPSQQPTVPTTPAVSYVYIDATELKNRINAKYPDPMEKAYQFRSALFSTDMMRCAPRDRVRQATELADVSKALFNDAFTKYTGGASLPTPQELTNIHTLEFRVKQDYERINNVVCSNKTFEELKSLIETIEDFVRLDQGKTMIGNTDSSNLKWSIFTGGRTVTPFDVFEYAASLVPVSTPNYTSPSTAAKIK